MQSIVLDFLTNLRENNNREWFQDHKGMYDKAKGEVENFIHSLLPLMSAFDESIRFVSPRDCMFRIFRDVRFSKNKSPYKENMGAWITPAGRKSSGPGYYVHLQPGGSFLAVGVYMPDPEQLKKVRKEVYYNVSEFLTILNEKQFRKYFNGLDSMDQGKMAPRDFPKDFEHIDLLKHKHYIVSCPVEDHQIVRDDFGQLVCDVFKAAAGFNNFLRRGLQD